MNACFPSPASLSSPSRWLAFLALPLALSGQTTTPNSAAADEPVKLSVFTVSVDKDKGYGATNSIGGSRVNVPMREIPSYTISLNEQFLKDVGTVDMLDAINYVSGVRTAGQGQGDTQYSLRGYAQSGNGTVYRDGLPDRDSSVDVSPNDSASYERIEILKGPAGVLYGSHNLGGIVNRVSKMPKSTPQTSIEMNVSSGWDDYIRGMVDTTGPIDADGRTAYRVVIADREGERSWGGVDNRRTFLGVLRHAFGKEKQTRVWARLYRYDTETNRDQGWNFIDKDAQLPGFYLGKGRDYVNFPLDANSNQRTVAYELGAETSFKAIGVDWSVRLLGRESQSDGDKTPSYAGGAVTALDATGKVLGNNRQISWLDPRVADWRTSLTVRDFQGYIDQTGGYLDVVGKFDLGPTNHTLILSGSSSESQTRRVFYFWAAKFPGAPAALPNTYSLIPGRAEKDLQGKNFTSIQAESPRQFNAFQNESKGEGSAFGVQDSIAILDRRLIAVVGARNDHSSGTSYTLDANLNRLTARKTAATEWTFKYGLVTEPVKGASLFAHHSTTFNPVSSVNPATGTTFPNQDGSIDEVGIKLELFKGKLVATASVFDMSLTNIIIQVVNPPELGGGTRPQAVGEQKTKGWETDIAWQPIDGLNVFLGYSDLTSVSELGIPFRNVSQTPTYSIFTKYVFQDGAFKGFGAGFGYLHNGKRPGDATNSFILGEIDQLDLNFSYAPPGKKWDVQLNVLNVTDEQGLAGSVSATIITPQTPVTYRGTFTYRF
jgi:outer membrane receptor protein involved in Fe transport